MQYTVIMIHESVQLLIAHATTLHVEEIRGCI